MSFDPIQTSADPVMVPPRPKREVHGIERRDEVRALREQIEATSHTSFRENEADWKRIRDKVIEKLPYPSGYGDV